MTNEEREAVKIAKLVMRCETCRHWGDDRELSRGSMDVHATCLLDEFHGVSERTWSDFGCIMWEPRE